MGIADGTHPPFPVVTVFWDRTAIIRAGFNSTAQKIQCNSGLNKIGVYFSLT